jgi:hypothetical protein
MARKKSREEIESGTIKWTETVKAISSIINSGIIWVGIVFCVFYLSQALISFAGQQTNANILISLIADLKANQWFGYIVGGTGIGYGALQHNLRKKNITRLAGRVDYFEKGIDPQKGSSALAANGETETHE